MLCGLSNIHKKMEKDTQDALTWLDNDDKNALTQAGAGQMTTAQRKEEETQREGKGDDREASCQETRQSKMALRGRRKRETVT